ncbi:hypothetical protein J8J42_00390 [Chryseobacterium sp. cx-311]|uniref:hypothetical protein n=1 Tax=Marnyiella aurantia TaxID=2758037 RepID=UPI001AEB5B7B|nr:hypothetical protein [Marnyiella aurantia]MBP0611503.1 hypothetical protein [Marnyiella aurantia]
MKKILLIAILCTSYSLYRAQSNGAKTNKDIPPTAVDSLKKKCSDRKNQVIVYDFQKGEYEESMLKPCIKVPTILKIKNVNPLYYSIQIEAADRSISYLNEDQQELVNYKIENRVEVEPLVEGKHFNLNNAILSSLNRKVDNKAETVSEYRESYVKTLDSLIKAGYDLTKTEEDIEKDSLQNEQLLETKNKLQEKIRTLEKSLLLLEKGDTKNNLFKEAVNGRLLVLNESFELLKDQVNKIIKINQNYNNYLDKISSPFLTSAEYIKIRNASPSGTTSIVENSYLLNTKNLAYGYKINNDYPQLRQRFFTDLNKLIYHLNSNNNGTVEQNLIVTFVTQEVERMRMEVVEFEKIVTEINLSKRLNQVEIFDRILKDDKNYQYVSHPIQGIGDYLEFKISIKSRKKQQNYFSSEEKDFRYFEYLKGGMRLDFSAGVVFNFGTQTNTYTISDDIIAESSNNRFMPDLGIFVHSSFRGNAITTFGLSLGTSLDLGKFDINSIYVGPSVLIGKKDKFIFTAGPAFRNVEELRPNYQIGSKAGTSNPVDIVTENFKIGIFFAISYNLTTKQKGVMEFSK